MNSSCARSLNFPLVRPFLLLLLALLLSSCGGSGSSVDPGTLRVTALSDPKSFNVLTAREASTSDILGLVYEGLVRTDPVTYEVIPDIADTWTVSADGRTWTFTLRKDVNFADGHPLTARDVEFTFNRLILNPAVQCGMRDLWQVEGKPFVIRMLDTWTITVETAKPFAPLLRVLGAPILPEHALRDVADFNQALGINTPVDQVLGSGPFRLKSYEPGVRVVLEANPNYWRRDEDGQPLPRLKKIVVNVVTDADADVEWFRAAKSDYVFLRGHDWPSFAANPSGYRLWNMGPRFSTTFLFFNQNLAAPIPDERKAWFRDPAFRQAVARAVDRPTIIQSVYNGLAFAQHSCISEANRVFHDSSAVIAYPYDLEAAAGILRDAGYKLSPAGKLLDPRGVEVAFELTTNANNNERVRMATVIAESLKKLGMNVTVSPMEFNALVDRLDNSLQWEACIMGLTESLDPHNGSNIWRVEGELHMFNQRPRTPAPDASAEVKEDHRRQLETWKRGIQPWEREIEEIMARGAVTLDPVERRRIYSRFQAVVSRELPMIYTVAPAALYATRDRIQGIEPSPIGSTAMSAMLHNAERLQAN